MNQYLSLKNFFNRRSPVFLSVIGIAWFLVLYRLYQFYSTPHEIPLTYLTMVSLAALLALIKFYPWYPKEHRGLGIEEHFDKTVVPVHYLLLLVHSGWFFLGSLTVLHGFLAFFFAIILIVNSLMIYFYCKDKDTMPPSFFSRHTR